MTATAAASGEGQPSKTKTATERREAEFDARVASVVERARRPGYDATVRVRHLEPEPPAPPEQTECADCGLAFLPGEGKRRDPARHDLFVHTNQGCDRARMRAAARAGAPPPASPPVEEESVEAATAESQAEATQPNPILDYLEAHGEATAQELATVLDRKTGNVSTRLRQMEQDGRVRRTGRSVGGGRGGPQIVWALANGEPSAKVIDAPPPASSVNGRVRRELLEFVRAEDLATLLDGYCHGIPLAEADADMLALVLRVRRAIELLSDADA